MMYYIISISKLYQYKNVWTHFLISEMNSSLGFDPGFTVIAWSRFIKPSRTCSISADRMQRVLADLSHQHATTCFYPITFPRILDLSSQQRTMDQPWWRFGAVEKRRKFTAAGKTMWCGEGERSETEISCPLVDQSRRTGLVVL